MKKSLKEFQRMSLIQRFLASCSLLAAIILAPTPSMAQSTTLSGTVKDGKGEPVMGAAVMLTGTKTGAATNLDGTFTMTLAQKPSANSTLTFSCIGYTTVVVPINNRSVFDVVMNEESTVMDESVVIGYSTIKKKDLTGSISTLGGAAVANRQTPTVSNALQGAMPGVTVTRTSSAPGGSATIRIRGITSMTSGASDPYVLVDGVPGYLTDLNPNDIENITVLKDAASASIYGSQAAAGVILVTTKRSKEGTSSVNYSYSLGIDTPSSMPDYMNSVDYMKAVNELRYNDLPSGGWYQEFGKDLIDNYWSLNKQNPDLYPNVDWVGLLLKKNALRHSHNVSFTTSSAKNRSAISLGYDDVNGLFAKNLDWTRYTVRVNNDLNIYKWLKLSVDMSFKFTDTTNPHSSPSAIMRYIPGIYAAVWSNGKYAPGKDGVNKYASLVSGGTDKNRSYLSAGKFQLDITPIKDLTITALFAPRISVAKDTDFQRQTSYFQYGDTSESSTTFISDAKITSLEETRGDVFVQTSQAYANYSKTLFLKHNVSAMAGYENYYYKSGGIDAKNSSFPTSLIADLSAGGTEDVTATSYNVAELARNSFFGRLMYNYDSKYYVQGNIRRDGSSRFAKECRWGTFLSASAGWVFTREPFMQSLKDIVNHGKLRISYGELGNERINGYYPYQTVLGSNNAVAYEGTTVVPVTGYSQSAAVVKDLTWESTATSDLGLDLQMFKDRLSFTGDVYYKKTSDMLLTVPIAPIIGLSDPYDNVGDMNTKGWEVSIGWRDVIGDFSYSVNANVSDEVSKVGYIGGKRIISGGKIIQEGTEYDSWYGYQSDGIYQTQDEIVNSAKIGTVYPGDIKYKNIADADATNPIISTEYDRTVLGSSLPHYNFGGNIDLGWKNFDFNMTFQGVGKRNSYLTEEMVEPMRSQWYNVPSILAGKSWSRKNTIAGNLDAKYPRYSWNSEGNNYAISDFWLIDGSYFRIKDITLGYSLPAKWASKIYVKGLRFSATLSDFFTFSHFPKGWDPEVGVASYPITKSVLFSAQIKF